MAGPSGPAFLYNFYPRSPCGERLSAGTEYDTTENFYPRSPCGERRQIKQNCRAETSISIHALLAESDRLCRILYSCPGNFYPRSPCGERPDKHAQQPTQPNFYPRSPCGERRANSHGERQGQHISIHALLAESDQQPEGEKQRT